MALPKLKKFESGYSLQVLASLHYAVGFSLLSLTQVIEDNPKETLQKRKKGNSSIKR
jgi:hypothetical protein